MIQEIGPEQSLGKLVEQFDSEYKENVTTLKSSLSEIGHTNGAFVLDNINNPLPQTAIIRNYSKITQIAKEKHWWSEIQKDSLLRNPLTHTTYAMSGILTVPYEEIPQFRAAFLEDIMENNLHYYCEYGIPGEKMKLSFDLDVESRDEKDMWSGIRQMIQVVVNTVREFFKEKETIQCIVCISLPYLKTRDGLKYNHWGVHMYFQDVIVDHSMFYTIRDCIVAKMKQILGERKTPDRNSWEKLVDDNVPKSGLRLIFARRPARCPYTPPTAKKCKTQNCSLCCGSKGIPGSSIYFPYLIFKNEKIDIVQTKQIHNWRSLTQPRLQREHWMKMIEWCSIRPYYAHLSAVQIEVSSEYMIPVYAQMFVRKNRKELLAAGEKQNKKTNPTNLLKTGVRGEKWVDARSEIYKIIKELWTMESFTQQLHEKHRGLTFKISTNSCNNVLNLNTNCKFCLHLGKEHGNCKVYFVISRMKKKTRLTNPKQFYMQQHCWCRNQCAGYQSDPVDVPEIISRQLFPHIFKQLDNPETNEKKSSRVALHNRQVTEAYSTTDECISQSETGSSFQPITMSQADVEKETFTALFRQHELTPKDDLSKKRKNTTLVQTPAMKKRNKLNLFKSLLDGPKRQ